MPKNGTKPEEEEAEKRIGFFLRIPESLNEKLVRRQFRESKKAGHQISKNALINSILKRSLRA